MNFWEISTKWNRKEFVVATILDKIFLDSFSRFFFSLPEMKRNKIIIIRKWIYELPLKLPNDLRLQILGNYETLRKSPVWLNLMGSAQTATQKASLEICARILPKIRYEPFHKKKLFYINLWIIFKLYVWKSR